jgi:putative redox protein
MGVEIDVVYEGSLHCQATHKPSGAVLATDAPVDNGGKGEAFSPTDLVAAALGTCIVTIMGLVAKRSNLPIEGTKINVVKEMAADPIRRIGSLIVTVTVPNAKGLSASDRAKLQAAADSCPVKQSLHSDIKVPVKFVYVD